MSIFEEVDKKFGRWIQVLDTNNHNITIENYDYALGVHGDITTNHCAKCVSINKCWFKDEKDKKPVPYPISEIEWLDDIAHIATPGLYHYNCHCYENGIITPTPEDIKLLVTAGKIDWLFKDKQSWINSMGYNDNKTFLKTIFHLIRQAYCNGDYKIIKHDKYGAKINLFITIPGIGIKQGHIYPVKSAFMIFPNGKLKCNTILGGRQ